MDIETAQFNSQNAEFWVYETTFRGRRSGAIGISDWYGHTITSDTPLTDDAVRLKLYDDFENIQFFKINKSYLVNEELKHNLS
jgi:hypothetical protein